jgi:hypothetical protein
VGSFGLSGKEVLSLPFPGCIHGSFQAAPFGTTALRQRLVFHDVLDRRHLRKFWALMKQITPMASRLFQEQLLLADPHALTERVVVQPEPPLSHPTSVGRIHRRWLVPLPDVLRKPFTMGLAEIVGRHIVGSRSLPGSSVPSSAHSWIGARWSAIRSDPSCYSRWLW